MMWFLLAFLAAVFASVKDIFNKKGLRHVDEYTAAWLVGIFTVAFLIPLLFVTEIPPIGDGFVRALVLGGCLGAIATILYLKAIKESDLSLVMPLISFTPLFMLVTSPIIVGEFPSAFGLAGIILIVTGSYVLNIQEGRNGLLAPFKALLEEGGQRKMLAVTFIWSITANIDKVGVQNSSPVFWIIAVTVFTTTLVSPAVLLNSKRFASSVRPGRGLKALSLVSFFNVLTLVCQMIAIKLTLVAYVIAIKRVSAVLGVLWGHAIFKERGVKARLAGALIMMLGVILIALL